MTQTIGYSTTQEDVGDGSSLSSPITVDALGADTVYIYVTDGSGGTVSESYDLTVEVQKGTPHDSSNELTWFEETNLSVSGSTAKRHRGNTSGGHQLRVDLTNVSDAGSTQTYEIIVHARKEGSN